MQPNSLIKFKAEGQKIACLTAYDYCTAQLLDESGIDMILVGDSLANTFAGLDNSYELDFEDILYHCKVVKRGIQKSLLVADMPFGSYQISRELAIQNAIQLLKAGAAAVKIEGGETYVTALVKDLHERGIPSIGHLGYTPQSALVLGKGRRQGREETQAQRIKEQALALQDAGAVAVVLELVPSELASQITQALQIPTIGIGAGPDCDGQILVTDDLLGKYERSFSFVKRYAELGQQMKQAFSQYQQEVKGGDFPAIS